MRRLTTISLLFIFILSQSGYYLFYKFQQQEIRKTVREKIHSGKKIQVLTEVDEQNSGISLTWQEEGEEFILNGKMYDVVCHEKVNGRDILYCYEDKEEDNLESAFADIYNKDHKKDEGSSKCLQAFSISDFCFTEAYTPKPFTCLLSRVFNIENISLESRCTESFFPHPKV